MTESRGQRLRGAVVHGLLRATAALPMPAVHGLGAVAGWLAWQARGRLRRVTEANLAVAFPDMAARERRRLGRRSLMETGKTLFETGPMWLWPWQRLAPLAREVEGWEHLEAGLARGRGVIVAAPHLGSWEMVGNWISQSHPMTNLYRPPRLAAVEGVMRHGRERFGSHIVPTDGRGVKSLMQVLRRGAIAGILPDQEPRQGGQGVFAPYFGRPALTMTLLPRLAQKSGASVLLVWAERLPYGRGYRLCIEPAPPAVADADPERAATCLNEGVEAAVRRCPEQYQWSYKRFRKRPEGVPRLY